MPVTIGTQLGSNEIIGLLGKGGIGRSLSGARSEAEPRCRVESAARCFFARCRADRAFSPGGSSPGGFESSQHCRDLWFGGIGGYGGTGDGRTHLSLRLIGSSKSTVLSGAE